MAIRIAEAVSDAEVDACFPAMAELRPHLDRAGFVPTVRRLAALSDGGVAAVAGFRVGEWLAGGRYLEVEDLVTAAAERSRGRGAALLAWIMDVAAREGCAQVRLVSNVRRADAHRSYLREGMALEAYYFSRPVGP